LSLKSAQLLRRLYTAAEQFSTDCIKDCTFCSACLWPRYCHKDSLLAAIQTQVPWTLKPTGQLQTAPRAGTCCTEEQSYLYPDGNYYCTLLLFSQLQCQTAVNLQCQIAKCPTECTVNSAICDLRPGNCHCLPATHQAHRPTSRRDTLRKQHFTSHLVSCCTVTTVTHKANISISKH